MQPRRIEVVINSLSTTAGLRPRLPCRSEEIPNEIKMKKKTLTYHSLLDLVVNRDGTGPRCTVSRENRERKMTMRKLLPKARAVSRCGVVADWIIAHSRRRTNQSNTLHCIARFGKAFVLNKWCRTTDRRGTATRLWENCECLLSHQPGRWREEGFFFE